MDIAINPRACLDGSGSPLGNEVFDEGEGIDTCDYLRSAGMRTLRQRPPLLTVRRWLSHDLDVLNGSIDVEHVEELLFSNSRWQVTDKD